MQTRIKAMWQCGGCRKLINGHYFYCPWCGLPAAGRTGIMKDGTIKGITRLLGVRFTGEQGLPGTEFTDDSAECRVMVEHYESGVYWLTPQPLTPQPLVGPANS